MVGGFWIGVVVKYMDCNLIHLFVVCQTSSISLWSRLFCWVVEKDRYTQKAALTMSVVGHWDEAEEAVGCASTGTSKTQ